MDPPNCVEKIHDKSSNFRITGVEMQYVAVCKREAWFYMNGILSKQTSPSIMRGKSIDENSYTEEDDILIDNLIRPDIIKDSDKIIETKPSSKLLIGAKMQLLYYLWYMEYFKQEQYTGEIAIPEEKRRQEVPLNTENKKELFDHMKQLHTLWKMDSPPEFEEKPYCDSCAYKEICWQ